MRTINRIIPILPLVSNRSRGRLDRNPGAVGQLVLFCQILGKVGVVRVFEIVEAVFPPRFRSRPIASAVDAELGGGDATPDGDLSVAIGRPDLESLGRVQKTRHADLSRRFESNPTSC